MHIAVCDDNVADRKQLERLLGRECDKRKNDTGVFYTDSFGQSTTLARNPMPYDLFFIDLTAEATDGLTLTLSLRKFGVTAPIVLCSSKIDYLSAYKELPEPPTNIMFLEKPIKAADLAHVLDQAIAMQQSRTPTIELRSEIETFYVQEDDIMYAVSEGKNVNVFLKDGSKVPVISDMDNFYEQVAMYSHMALLTGHTMCNVAHMESYSPFQVIMKDGTKLKSSPFSMKYIKWSLNMYNTELKQ